MELGEQQGCDPAWLQSREPGRKGSSRGSGRLSALPRPAVLLAGVREAPWHPQDKSPIPEASVHGFLLDRQSCLRAEGGGGDRGAVSSLQHHEEEPLGKTVTFTRTLVKSGESRETRRDTYSAEALCCFLPRHRLCSFLRSLRLVPSRNENPKSDTTADDFPLHPSGQRCEGKAAGWHRRGPW